MGGGGGATNTIEENPLPDWAQPYVEEYLTRADALSRATYSPYSGATYATRNQNEIDGIAALAGRAANGSPTVNIGISLLVSTLKGELLSGYPQKNSEWAVRANEVYDDFIYTTLPQIDTNANNAGGFGGSGHIKMKIAAARALFNKIAALAYEIYGSDYFSERKFMGDAIAAAGDYAGNSVADVESHRMAGLYEREYQQGLLSDFYMLWFDEQENAKRRLNIIGNAIRAMVGAQVETTTPLYRPSEMAEIAGIALAGLSAVGAMYRKDPTSGGTTTTATSKTGSSTSS